MKFLICYVLMQIHTPVFLNKDNTHQINKTLLTYKEHKKPLLLSFKPNRIVKFTFKAGLNGSNIEDLINDNLTYGSELLNYDARVRFIINKRINIVLGGGYKTVIGSQTQFISLDIIYKLNRK